MNGKKTYIAVLAGILGVVASYSSGNITLADAINQALVFLGVAGLRHGVEKNGSN